MQMYVTNLGASVLAEALLSGKAVDITTIQIGSSIISGYTEAQLLALTQVVDQVYSNSSLSFTPSIQNSNTIVFSVTLDGTVGNFNIGNYGLFDSNNNLIIIVALDSVIPKNNNTSSSGQNVVVLYPVLTYTSALEAINVNLSTTLNASLPVVATSEALPPAGTSEYNAYIVSTDDTLANTTSFAVVGPENTWQKFADASYIAETYAALAGNPLQNFAVANAVTGNQAINLGQASGLYVPQINNIKGINCVPFTVNSSFTVPPNVNLIRVTLYGAGGGGGGLGSSSHGSWGGSGGGGGGVGMAYISVTPGAVIPITIGGAGSPGNSGGSSSFGNYFTCGGGGAGGGGGDGSMGGSGGNVYYANGANGIIIANNAMGYTGNESYHDGASGGNGGGVNGGTTNTNGGFGGGGGGGSTYGNPGYGGQGICWVEW